MMLKSTPYFLGRTINYPETTRMRQFHIMSNLKLYIMKLFLFQKKRKSRKKFRFIALISVFDEKL
jgi:hypothetical protein